MGFTTPFICLRSKHAIRNCSPLRHAGVNPRRVICNCSLLTRRSQDSYVIRYICIYIEGYLIKQNKIPNEGINRSLKLNYIKTKRANRDVSQDIYMYLVATVTALKNALVGVNNRFNVWISIQSTPR